MKAIKNIDCLEHTLYTENPEWQQNIYDQTGVIVLLRKGYGTLFNNCGYIDLDRDAEYCSKNGVDCTEYCEIKSIEELINYIKSMESYNEFLCDTSYGKFTKSELFWAIYARIISPLDNQRRPDGSIYQDWSLFSIGSYQKHIDLYMALVDYDSREFRLDISPETELNEALTQLALDMCHITEAANEVPQYTVCKNANFVVPNRYEELKAQLSGGGLFHWLG